MAGRSDSWQTLALLKEAVDALRQADAILVDKAHELGWIGVGVLSYVNEDNNVMMQGDGQGGREDRARLTMGGSMTPPFTQHFYVCLS